MGKSNKQTKNPAAVALGRLGGLRGGPARAKMLTAAKDFSEDGRWQLEVEG
jgi:hypothetical protein